MKKKKILYILGAVVCIFSTIIIHNILTTPDVDFIYDYNGKAYIQNSRSILKKEIVLSGYDNINNIIVTEEGWFCCAKSDNHNCFLFVTKNNEIYSIFEESNYYSEISNVVVCNGMYQMIYTYQESINSEMVKSLLSVDFKGQKLIYSEYPSEFSAYSFLSDGNNLWGSNGEKILEYKNESYIEITDGDSVIGIQGDDLLFENDNRIYKLNLSTKEIVPFEANINLHDYRTVDFESKLNFTDKYIMGCEIGFLKLSGGNSLFTHVSVCDLSSKKNHIVFGSIGKLIENIQIISNRNEYKAFK